MECLLNASVNTKGTGWFSPAGSLFKQVFEIKLDAEIMLNKYLDDCSGRVGILCLK